MIHNRKYLGGQIGLVRGRIKSRGYSERDAIEALILQQTGFLEKAPFDWVHPSFHLGLRNQLKPRYLGIDRQYKDIGVTIEIKMEVVKAADQISVDLLRDIFMIGALECLIDIGRKYQLPIDLFVAERAKYKKIPETAEEVNALPGHRLLRGPDDPPEEILEEVDPTPEDDVVHPLKAKQRRLKVSEAEVAHTLQLPAETRYQYFWDMLRRHGCVWCLGQKNRFASTTDKDDTVIFPLWPAYEYAKLSAHGDWAGSSPKALNEEDLFYFLLPTLKNRGNLAGIFYLPDNHPDHAAACISAEQFQRELEALTKAP